MTDPMYMCDLHLTQRSLHDKSLEDFVRPPHKRVYILLEKPEDASVRIVPAATAFPGVEGGPSNRRVLHGTRRHKSLRVPVLADCVSGGKHPHRRAVAFSGKVTADRPTADGRGFATVDLRHVFETHDESTDDEDDEAADSSRAPTLGENESGGKEKKSRRPRVWSVLEYNENSTPPPARIPALNKPRGGVGRSLLQQLAAELPLDVHWDVLKFLNYDQVSWLADENTRFLRDLACSRYKIDPTNEDRDVLLESVRRETCKEMRFGDDEDLWVVPVCPDGNWKRCAGIARRFPITPGAYKWHVATATTHCHVDPEGVDRYRLYGTHLQIKGNQIKTMCGESTIRSLVLAGTECTRLKSDFTALQFEYVHKPERTESPDEYRLHMWVEGTDNAWLRDVVTPDGVRCGYRDLPRLHSYNILLFKDPVKFFGVVKVAREIDKGLLCFTSRRTGEVIGYLVDNPQYRFRIPVGTDRITGLNFVSEYFRMEAQGIAEHTRFQTPPRTRVDVVEGNTRHVHEVYPGGFGVCVHVLHHRLGESGTAAVARRYVQRLIDVCERFTEQDRDWVLGCVSPNQMQLLFSRTFGEELNVPSLRNPGVSSKPIFTWLSLMFANYSPGCEHS